MMACDLSTYSRLINRLLNGQVSFAIIRRPGAEACELVDFDRFVAVPWRGEKHGATAFSNERQPSTHHDHYIKEVSWLVSAHRRRGGKTVISRVFDIDRLIDIPGVAEQYFDVNPHAMCALFYTPQTGCWLVASPEVLVSASGDDLQTMALAGTRPIDSEGAWDDKNRREQEIVTEFIGTTLDRMGIPYITDDPVTLKAAGVEHLCTHFDARLPQGITPRQVADALNPTPALCGMPRHTAMFDIGVAEKHRRQMYGGYFAIKGENKFDAYVMVRCARLWPDGANVFAGGGITAGSDPEAEWQEAALKAAPLLSIIKQNSITLK